MNALAFFSLECWKLHLDIPAALKDWAIAFRKGLHEDKDDMLELYEDLANHYKSEILPNMHAQTTGLAQFFNNYLTLVHEATSPLVMRTRREPPLSTASQIYGDYSLTPDTRNVC